ncbi:lycopene cyclase domain-containing protein [Cryobacterium psychrophilum]|uniref:Lycopene cyclase domain-containing protein n=1 Tax=Cryobacterium psychrophilum TaxID=41988 RepID=A0A4Y8KSH9_9MICO|nr:lycopene cyclase domain-containing protein [Cryobacterium psychrophilum]TDW29663.1 lycopene cyclase domain-containing protein [Cryobacterium psychrophilum]TFD81777.1 lycopene cyclase domain-containing protein [Cryobacterium psychrophilum]
MSLSYLVILVVVIGCMVLIDRRYRLFFWKDAPRAAAVLVIGVAFFLVWDLLGIYLGIFFRGETSFMTGVLLAPELPLEEPLFLAFLCYLIMVLIGGIEPAVSRVRERRS